MLWLFIIKQINMLKQKYRAKILGTNEWIYGYPHSVYGHGFDSIQDYNNSKRIEYVNINTLSISIDRKDKNGKEIFTGDYDNDGNCLIFCKECMGFQFALIDNDNSIVLDCHNCEGNFYFQEHINDFIVIGNIY